MLSALALLAVYGLDPSQSAVRLPSAASLGKVARSAGWGMARCFDLWSDCTSVVANLRLNRPAFHTPSGPSGRLPRFVEKGVRSDRPRLDDLREWGRLARS
jgi:hypothetical protein